MQTNFVQIRHPITRDWIKVSTITGRIVGSKSGAPYVSVPVRATLPGDKRK